MFEIEIANDYFDNLPNDKIDEKLIGVYSLKEFISWVMRQLK